MKIKLEKALKLKFEPLAFFFANEIPTGIELSKQRCVIAAICQAAKGKTIAISKESCKCKGAINGLALQELNYDNFPGGLKGFCNFLSLGNKNCIQGMSVIKKLKENKADKHFIEEYTEGEAYLKTAKQVENWISCLPKLLINKPYLIIKPLKELKDNEIPLLVSFLVNPNQLSALRILTNFVSEDTDNVSIPFGAGCGCFVLLPLAETKKEKPKAIIGLTDISARLYSRKTLGNDILSFTVPYKMFKDMEDNIDISFLNRFTWKTIIKNM